jgi:hypothetical protein
VGPQVLQACIQIRHPMKSRELLLERISDVSQAKSVLETLKEAFDVIKSGTHVVSFEIRSGNPLENKPVHNIPLFVTQGPLLRP